MSTEHPKAEALIFYSQPKQNMTGKSKTEDGGSEVAGTLQAIVMKGPREDEKKKDGPWREPCKDQQMIVEAVKTLNRQIEHFAARKRRYRALARESREASIRLMSNATAQEKEAEAYADAIRVKKKELTELDSIIGVMNCDVLAEIKEEIPVTEVVKMY